MDESGGSAYRDAIAAAYARIESLESEARALRATASELDAVEQVERLRRLERHARAWDRARTTLAILLGLAVIVAMNVAEHFGASAGMLVASVAMLAVGLTLAWPSLSARRALAVDERAARGEALDRPTRVRVSVRAEPNGRGTDDARPATIAERLASAGPSSAPERAR
jgi:hypothetical protein